MYPNLLVNILTGVSITCAGTLTGAGRFFQFYSCVPILECFKTGPFSHMADFSVSKEKSEESVT